MPLRGYIDPVWNSPIAESSDYVDPIYPQVNLNDITKLIKQINIISKTQDLKVSENLENVCSVNGREQSIEAIGIVQVKINNNNNNKAIKLFA